MATATLKIEFNAGTSVDEAFTEALRLAKLLLCWIEFNFNGVTCMATYTGTVKRGVESYQEEIVKKHGYRLATA